MIDGQASEAHVGGATGQYAGAHAQPAVMPSEDSGMVEPDSTPPAGNRLRRRRIGCGRVEGGASGGGMAAYRRDTAATSGAE